MNLKLQNWPQSIDINPHNTVIISPFYSALADSVVIIILYNNYPLDI